MRSPKGLRDPWTKSIFLRSSWTPDWFNFEFLFRPEAAGGRAILLGRQPAAHELRERLGFLVSRARH